LPSSTPPPIIPFFIFIVSPANLWLRKALTEPSEQEEVRVRYLRDYSGPFIFAGFSATQYSIGQKEASKPRFHRFPYECSQFDTTAWFGVNQAYPFRVGPSPEVILGNQGRQNGTDTILSSAAESYPAIGDCFVTNDRAGSRVCGIRQAIIGGRSQLIEGGQSERSEGLQRAIHPGSEEE